jgi:SPP1 gp7 family putative phage head morphogenesis protein
MGMEHKFDARTPAPGLQGRLDVPFKEALDFAKKREVVLPEVYYGKLPAEARAAAFSVTGMAQIDQIQSVLDSLNKALETGQSFTDWQEQASSNIEELAGLSEARQELIFRNATHTAYSTGKWQQYQDNKDMRPYLMYSAILDSRTRPTHRAMNGVIRPIDDPIWEKWTPPAGFACRCTTLSLNAEQAKTYSQGEKGLNQVVTDAMQPDAGWDYNPATGHLDALEAAANDLAKNLPETTQRAASSLLQQFSSLVDTTAKISQVASHLFQVLGKWPDWDELPTVPDDLLHALQAMLR